MLLDDARGGIRGGDGCGGGSCEVAVWWVEEAGAEGCGGVRFICLRALCGRS